MREPALARDFLPKLWVDQKVIDAIPQRMMERGLPDEVLQATQLEVRGGPCPICGVPFAAKQVKNRFADFTMYEPACHCYRSCIQLRIVPQHGRPYTLRGCGRHLVVEKLLGITQCTNCGAESV